MTDLLEPYTNRFEPVSLADLNSKAALLDRSEKKYLFEAGEFLEIIADLEEHFSILEIEGKRVFGYKSLYFDTEDLMGYTYHNQGRTKRRFKVRTRQYVDSGLCYFEVKLKNKRGGTIKKRITYSSRSYKRMTQTAQRFLADCYQQVYGHTFKHRLAPQLQIDYNRITLVAKAGGERMTIDFNLTFSGDSGTTEIKPLLIVETKSSNGRGIADGILRRRGIRSRSCSKYCLGLNVLQYGVKYNRFKQLLKLYNNLPAYQPAQNTELAFNELAIAPAPDLTRGTMQVA